jgi:DNA-binding NarL/FixJ family response regulator
MGCMRCLVVEDEPHWQTTIQRIIAGHETLELIRICPNLAEALSTIRSTPYEMLIVDLGLPDGSGVDAIRTSRRLRPDADILVATVFDDERSVVNAICAGATGYLVKDSTSDEWISAIAQLRAGHSPLSPKIARHILRRLQEPARAKRMGLLDGASAAEAVSASAPEENVSLSARESEVLQLVAKGFSLVEVAQILHVSHTTTRTHAKSIYRKLEVNSRGEAVFEATRLGLL